MAIYIKYIGIKKIKNSFQIYNAYLPQAKKLIFNEHSFDK